MKQWIVGLLLVGILVVGIWFRLYNLTDVPHGFFTDEAAIGYNAYTILHYGTDEYGKVFPLFFESFGDYKDPVQIYFTVPFVLIFGLTEFATRLPSVIWGLLTIVGAYLTTKEIKKSYIAALFAALAAATMPWLVHYNRVGFELNSYAALWIWTLYFFFKSRSGVIYFFPTALFLGLTLFSYQPAKLLIPLLLLGFLLTYHHILWRHRKYVWMSSFIFLLFAVPMAVSFFDVAGVARFSQVSIFSAHLPLNQMILRVLHNYFYQLSPAFFFSGDPTFITRHFTNGLLPLLPITLPFLALGLLWALITIKNASSQLLLWLLLIYPVAGAVVADAPFSSRAVIGAPLFAMLIGIGISLAIHAGKKQIGKIAITVTIILLFLVNSVVFAQFYFIQYPMYSSDFWGWQYGAGPVITYFITHQNEYDDFGMAGDFNGADELLKFYAPNGACSKCKVALPNDIYSPSRKQLFAMSLDDIKNNPQYTYTYIGSFYYPNGEEAFRLVKVHK